MRDKYFNSNELYVVCVCRYIPSQRGKTFFIDRQIHGYYIAKYKSPTFFKNGKFVLLTKHNAELQVLEEGYINGEYGVTERNPLVLCTKNLSAKVSYSQIVKLEKEMNDYYQNHKEEIDENYRMVVLNDFETPDEEDLEMPDEDDFGNMI